jgi:hypothetical protein
MPLTAGAGDAARSQQRKTAEPGRFSHSYLGARSVLVRHHHSVASSDEFQQMLERSGELF